MRLGPLNPTRSKRPVIRNGDDPFALMQTNFHDLWDRLLELSPPAEPQAFSPSVDVSETGKEIVIKADLPGLDESQINLEVQGDLLSLSGERSEEHAEEHENRHVVERSWGRFERSMRLPFVPGEKDVSTRFHKGVLTISIRKPKDLETAARRIPITRAD